MSLDTERRARHPFGMPAVWVAVLALLLAGCKGGSAPPAEAKVAAPAPEEPAPAETEAEAEEPAAPVSDTNARMAAEQWKGRDDPEKGEPTEGGGLFFRAEEGEQPPGSGPDPRSQTQPDPAGGGTGRGETPDPAAGPVSGGPRFNPSGPDPNAKPSRKPGKPDAGAAADPNGKPDPSLEPAGETEPPD